MATTNRNRRILKEVRSIEASLSTSEVISWRELGEGIMHFKATIAGPGRTPYEGGTFTLDIKIPLEYPFRPPAVKFDTKVWHPNISSQTGVICLDILDSSWSPVITIHHALLSVQNLLCNPEFNEPLDGEVAKMMITDRDAFYQRVSEWLTIYAGAPVQDPKLPRAEFRAPLLNFREEIEYSQYRGYNEDLVNRFVNMGFSISRVVESFDYVGIDENEGLDYELEEAYMGDITARLLGEP